MTELEILSQRLWVALEALSKIANLNCAKCEEYVAKADALAIGALIECENVAAKAGS